MKTVTVTHYHRRRFVARLEQEPLVWVEGKTLATTLLRLRQTYPRLTRGVLTVKVNTIFLETVGCKP